MSAEGVCEVWCLSPEGFECRLEMPVEGIDGVVALLAQLELAGFTPRQVKPGPSQQRAARPQPMPQAVARAVSRPQPAPEPTPPWCEQHGCQFRLFRKNGRAWWAHPVEETGGWCNSSIPVQEF